jgi:hypothetical protein
MNISKTEFKDELQLESVDELSQAQQQLNHPNREDSSLTPVEANELRCYFQLLRAGLSPEEAEKQAKAMTTTQLQSNDGNHELNGQNPGQQMPKKPTSRIEQILQRQQNLTHQLIELSHEQAELLEAKAWTQFQSTYATNLYNDINQFTDDMTALFSLMNSNIEKAEFIATEEYQPRPFDSMPKTHPPERIANGL